MKHLLAIFFVFLLVTAFQNDIAAQRRRFDDHNDRPGPERLEKFRKMRLVEVLRLHEEDAVRFFAKQSAHEEAQRGLMKSRNDALDGIENIVREEGDMRDVQKLADQVLSVDQKMFTERQRYQDDMRKFLSPEQFAKFLLFERNFGRQVKNALEEMREERRQKNLY